MRQRRLRCHATSVRTSEAREKLTYTWDVFVSYRRTGNVTNWVLNHLVPVLTRCLEDEMCRSPRVFLDTRIEIGSRWPDELAEALLRSRYMLCVWSPPYFSSDWCTAEWRSMLAREQAISMPAPHLIYPVVYSDGDTFPPEARDVQSRLDLSQYGYPYEQFSRTEAYLDFHARVRTIAVDLSSRLDAAPDWRQDWPIIRPNSIPTPRPQLPRLGAS